jgi:ATP-dependent helicase/DNAse subunit B
MSLTLVTGPANSAKAAVLLDGYRSALARSPILVVPRRTDAEHYQRELADHGAMLGVRVEPFSGLMREIARRAGVLERPLGEHARAAVIAAVLDGAKLQALAPAAQAPAFVEALARFIAELEARRVTPPRFSAAVRAWAREGTSRRGYVDELAGLYRDYRRRLERLGRLDSELHALRALDELSLAPDRWGGTPVFCYGFDDLDALQLAVIETLAGKVGAAVMLSLPGEPGRLALAGRAATLETLRPGAEHVSELDAQAEYYEEAALFHLERSLFEPPTPWSPGRAVRLLEGGDERAEAELVAAEVREMIDEGFSPGEIAIVTRSAGSTAELLAEVLDALAVPHMGARRDSLGASSVGRGLLALLRCASGSGEAADLVASLGVPGVVRHDLAVEQLEATLRRGGVSELRAARELWEREHGRLEALDGLARAARTGAGELLDQVEAALESLFAAPWLRAAALVDPWEAAAFGAARRALGDLRVLARSDPRLLGGIAGVTRALEALTVELTPAGERDAVLICDALSLRARRVRALFVCAMQEGTFPAPPKEQLFLGAAERAQLAAATGLVLTSWADWMAAERYLFYALCSRPTARLRVSWHAATDDGDAAPASLFVDDLRDCFTPELDSARRVRAAGAIAWEQGGPAPPALRRLEETLAAPRRRGVPIAGLQAPAELERLRGHAAFSPSSLEAWAGCPVAWFVERALSAVELAPDALALRRGSAAHGALATVFGELRERVPHGRLDSASLPLALEILSGALDHDVAPLSANAEVDRTERLRLRLNLERYLAFAATGESAHDPWQLELAFGLEGDPFPAVELADGALALCGRVDRVDRDESAGTIVVYDYKNSASVVPGALWAAERRFQPALYMRALEALQGGLEAVGGFYQPLRGKELWPRGAMRDDADPALELSQRDRLPPEEFEALIDGQIAAALEAAREIERGALEPRPATCGYLGGCMFPAICRCQAA